MNKILELPLLFVWLYWGKRGVKVSSVALSICLEHYGRLGGNSILRSRQAAAHLVSIP